MTVRQLNKSKRDTMIANEYKKYSSLKEFNVKKHTHDWICNKVADKWCLSAATIEKIISQNPK